LKDSLAGLSRAREYFQDTRNRNIILRCRNVSSNNEIK
jgi:hypothetical protein